MNTLRSWTIALGCVLLFALFSVARAQTSPLPVPQEKLHPYVVPHWKPVGTFKLWTPELRGAFDAIFKKVKINYDVQFGRLCTLEVEAKYVPKAKALLRKAKAHDPRLSGVKINP